MSLAFNVWVLSPAQYIILIKQMIVSTEEHFPHFFAELTVTWWCGLCLQTVCLCGTESLLLSPFYFLFTTISNIHRWFLLWPILHTHTRKAKFLSLSGELACMLMSTEQHRQVSNQRLLLAPPCLLVNSSTPSLAKRVTRSTPQQNCKPLCVNTLGNGHNRKRLFNLQTPITWCD